MRAWRVAMVGLLAAIFAMASFAAEHQVRFPPVLPGRDIRLPEDAGAHPEYRTEWWYVTGWITDEAGVERGFQVTFFRVRTGIGESSASRFAPRQLILAHAAVADPSEGRLLHAERSDRSVHPIAGAETGTTRVWSGRWSLTLDQDRYRSRVESEAFAFDLQFEPQGEPVFNGDRGFSRKHPDPRHASYYYSRPQLAVSGTLRLRERTVAVRGRAWLDHEWSSEYLPGDAKGWDWIGINLHDGGSLMAFRMRDASGRSVWSAATIRPAGGEGRTMEGERVAFLPLRRWRSSRTGAEYPVEWEIRLDGRVLVLRPLMDDQELDGRRTTGAVYWEGAVRVFEDGREIGRGYLEMTGYAERLRM